MVPFMILVSFKTLIARDQDEIRAIFGRCVEVKTRAKAAEIGRGCPSYFLAGIRACAKMRFARFTAAGNADCMGTFGLLAFAQKTGAKTDRCAG